MKRQLSQGHHVAQGRNMVHIQSRPRLPTLLRPNSESAGTNQQLADAHQSSLQLSMQLGRSPIRLGGQAAPLKDVLVVGPERTVVGW